MVRPFLHHIAIQILAHPQPEKLTIVLPSKRGIVFLKHYLAKEIKNPMWLPNMFSIEDFITELSGLHILDNLSLQFRLYAIFDAHRPKDNEEHFEQFLKWSQTILYDFNEIDRYLVDAKRLLTNLRDIKELEQWSLNSAELTSFQEKYVLFFEYLFDWYNQFTAALKDEQLAYQGLAYRHAAENIHNISHSFDQIWFVGLNALTAAEKQIIDFFVDQHKARLFWDADAYYMDNDNHEAGLFLRQHFEQWGQPSLSDYFSDPKHIEVVGCAKNVAQARVAGQLLSELDSNTETAIVLADENLLFPVLNNLPISTEEVNVTMGASLASTPLFSLIDLLFQTHLRKEQYRRDKFHFNDLINLLRHPYFSRLFSKDMVASTIALLKKQKWVFVTLVSLKSQVENEQQWQAFTLALGKWSDPVVAVHSLKQLLEIFKDTLVQEKANVESEALFSFYTSVQILENHILDFKGEMDLKTLRAIFFQIIGKESLAFMGEPLNGLQMMGVLETRTLDFKNLIVLSVNEEKLPAGKSVNSFIPYVLKKHFKLPTHEERDAIFAYHFYRLLQRADKTFLVYNTQNDEFGSGEKSRFITQLINEYKAGNIHQKILHTEVSTLAETEPLFVEKTPEVMAIVLGWASKRVSPTALSAYINCPLQFYFKYIARIHVEEDMVDFMESNTFGSIIHDALYQAYLPHLGNDMTKHMLNDIKNHALEVLASGFEQEVGEQRHHGKNHLIWQVARRLTSNYFDCEREALNDTSLTVLEVERTLEHLFDVNGVSVNLYGHVDRIDRWGDWLRIVDYKSGLVAQIDLSFSDFSELILNHKKAKAFQLMLYAFLYSHHQLTSDDSFLAGNYSLRNLNNGLVYIKQSKTTLKINALVIEEFETQLKKLISAILDEKQPFYPTDEHTACQWCDFKRVCGR